jgi:hypothetical protein
VVGRVVSSDVVRASWRGLTAFLPGAVELQGLKGRSFSFSPLKGLKKPGEVC